MSNEAKMNPAEWAPGTIVRWRNGADQILKNRKDDDTGWWLTDGSGLADTAWCSGDWRVVRGPVQQWCVGFLMDDDAQQVVLIRKTHPAWQAGKLNPVGGKVEPSDTSIFGAMEREFLEETGLRIPAWQHFLSLTWEEGIVHFFRQFVQLNVLMQVRTMTDEAVEIHAVRGLADDPIIPNLLWLVPLAAHRHDTYEVIKVVETGTTLRKIGRAGTDRSQPAPIPNGLGWS